MPFQSMFHSQQYVQPSSRPVQQRAYNPPPTQQNSYPQPSAQQRPYPQPSPRPAPYPQPQPHSQPSHSTTSGAHAQCPAYCPAGPPGPPGPPGDKGDLLPKPAGNKRFMFIVKIVIGVPFYGFM